MLKREPHSVAKNNFARSHRSKSKFSKTWESFSGAKSEKSNCRPKSTQISYIFNSALHVRLTRYLSIFYWVCLHNSERGHEPCSFQTAIRMLNVYSYGSYTYVTCRSVRFAPDAPATHFHPRNLQQIPICFYH